jgi:hypothetical protein
MYPSSPTMRDAVQVRSQLMDRAYVCLIIAPDELRVRRLSVRGYTPWKHITLDEARELVTTTPTTPRY